MKKYLLLIASLFLIGFTQAKTIERTYFFQNFIVQQQGEYSLIQAPGALNTAITGQALLPWYAAKVLLPPGESIESVEFIGKDLVQIPGNYQLLPKQYSQPISKGESNIFAKDKKFYKSTESYPASNTSGEYSSYWGGHSVGFVNYTPFVYIPKTGELSYYRQITVVIHSGPSPEAQQALNLLNSNNTELLSYVENPEDIKAYPIKETKNDDYEMLVITPNQFVEDFDTLVSHYLIRGIRTHVVSKEDILSEMSGQDDQEKIRNYIIQEYTNHQIIYVMLGGDVEHIPYRGFFCSVQSSSVYEDNNIPSDLYYSALDGNWNTDGDNKWGEIGEDDLLPEVAVARFSFSNSSELSKMLHKTISYQTEPVLGDLGHPMLAGEHLYDNPNTWGSDYLELLIGYHDDNGYETTGIPESNTFTKIYDKNATWSASTLVNEINQGKNFVHHVGHANENTVMKLYTSDITNSNFSGANGVDHQYTNVYTHGCICGSFDANDCIAEYMVKIDNFAAAFVGNSRYGWFNEGQTEGPSAHIHREFIDALYTDSLYRIGATHAESKYATSPWVNAPGQHEEGALRWCFYDCNVLGDPAMAIWTAEPWDITVSNPSVVTIGQNTYELDITSNGNPVEGLTAALVMDNVLYGSSLSDANGHCVLTLDPVFTTPGYAKLYVSGFNCTPHEYDVQIIPAEGAYVILQSYEIDDANGNNNQMLDYKETVNLNINLQNVGAVSAQNVIATISCDHPDITLNNATADFGQINGNSSINIEAAFNITASNDIENSSQVVFNMTIESGDDTWDAQFTIYALAPALNITSFDIDDAAGNNNGRLDPGETVNFIVNVANGGESTSSAVQALLSSNSDFISISNASQTGSALNPDDEDSFSFEIQVSNDAVMGDIAQLVIHFTAGNYTAYTSYLLAIGFQIEDWESDSFTQYDWTFGGDADWILTSNNTYEGDYCSQSGNIGDSQNTDMMIELNVINNDSISFFYKVSSESGYDFLRFYIDDNEKDKWSGEVAWERKVFAVSPGTHSFTWSYSKDMSADSGQDKAWVDYIVFPAMGIVSGNIENTLPSTAMKLYPNPATETAELLFENTRTQKVSIQIIDQNGQIVRIIEKQQYEKGQQKVQFHIENLAAGKYTVLIKTNDQTSTIGFIKL